MLKIVGSVYSDTGQVREQNEDNLYWQGEFRKAYELAGTLERDFNSSDDVQLYAVSDGMGGMARGELASRIAVSDLANLDRALKGGSKDYDIRKLDSYLRGCNDYIWERNQRMQSEDEAMGATISLLLLRDAEAVLVNMGDTAVYHLRDGLMKQISRDDSHAARLRSLGYLTNEEARKHPFKNSLVNYLGKSSPDEDLNYFLVPDIRLGEGDLLLMCSDGISGVLSREMIREVLNDGQSVHDKVKSLVNLAVASGSADNMTVILLRVIACADPSEAEGRKNTAEASEEPIEGEDLLLYNPQQSVREAAPDMTRRLIPPEETTVYRPLKDEAPEREEKVQGEAETPSAVKPVRVFSDYAQEEDGPAAPPKKRGELTAEELAYYNKARSEALQRRARRKTQEMQEEEMRTADKKPMSGRYSRPQAPPEHRPYMPDAHRSQPDPYEGQDPYGASKPYAQQGVRPMSREEKQRLYDMRYSDTARSPYVEGARPSYEQYRGEPVRQARGGLHAFTGFLRWLIFLIVFILLGYGITWFVIKALPYLF